MATNEDLAEACENVIDKLEYQFITASKKNSTFTPTEIIEILKAIEMTREYNGLIKEIITYGGE